MRYTGRIEFGMEIRYRHAKELQQYLDQEHENKQYVKAHLEISNDGRAIQWDGKRTKNLEYAVADVVRILNGWKYRTQGVLVASSPDKHYDIVVLKGKTKVFIDGEIIVVNPSQKTNQK